MLSVVIPSKDALNLIPCVRAIQNNESTFDVRIIVVDDGARQGAEPYINGVTWVDGIKPFCFSSNVNLGILAAKPDDVVILNDDALLSTPAGFTKMQAAAKLAPEYGVVSAVTNSVGNTEQMPRNRPGIRELSHTACFVCVFIPRLMMAEVGYLDENFRPAYFEDDDYCTRVRKMGYKVGAFDGCFVDHLSLRSTGRSSGDNSELMFRSLALYERKHGTHPRVPPEWRRRMATMGITA